METTQHSSLWAGTIHSLVNLYGWVDSLGVELGASLWGRLEVGSLGLNQSGFLGRPSPVAAPTCMLNYITT